MLIVKPGKTGLSRLIDATSYSIKGLKAAWLYEAAFRQELLACVVLIMSTFFMSVSNIERILLISSLLLVLTVELINSAIEAVVDRIGDEWHELSGRAKDIGSAAVFISLLLAGFVWLSILVK
nr:diacylglycerol kinase [Vibrio metschnikovii]